MTALDFFLYDNRTWSPQGRDWGLKAATGALAERTDLRADFLRYCSAVPSDQGQISGFGEALGGLSSRRRDSLLLCVTLERPDLFGRPAWTVVGLWCPDAATVERVLSADNPIASVREALRGEAVPEAIEILPGHSTEAARPRLRPRGKEIRRFEGTSTVRDVASRFLSMAKSGGNFQNVLGVTASLRSAGQDLFSIAFCHPMDERVERALQRIEASLQQEPPEMEPVLSERPAAIVGETSQRRQEAHRPREGRSAATQPVSWISLAIVFAVLVLVAGGVAIFVLQLRTFRHSSRKAESAPVRETEAVPDLGLDRRGAPPAERPVEPALVEVGKRVQEFQELDLGALHKSSGYVAAQSVPVLKEYQPNLKRVQAAFAHLKEIREKVIGPGGNYVAYYYEDEGGKRVAGGEKIKKITGILKDTSGAEDCEVLRDAFEYEFESPDLALRRWCDVIARFEATRVRLLNSDR